MGSKVFYTKPVLYSQIPQILKLALGYGVQIVTYVNWVISWFSS